MKKYTRNDIVINLISAVMAFKPQNGEFNESLIRQTIEFCAQMMEKIAGRKVSIWDKEEVFKQVTAIQEEDELVDIIISLDPDNLP